MNLSRLLFTFIISVGLPLTALCATVEPAEVLSRSLEELRRVHTARYMMTEHVFPVPMDTACASINVYRVIECENPADTFGNAKSVIFKPDGKLEQAYDGVYSYYGRYDSGFIEKNSWKNYNGIRYVQPPFYNHAMHLCEYLLEPNDKITITMEDEGDKWFVKAEVREWQQVCFFGKPYICPSMAYTKSYFALRINKSDMMPIWISYLRDWPQSRYERTVSEVEINPVAVEGFVIEDYIEDMPVYQDEEADKKIKESREKHYQEVFDRPFPTDTLQLVSGGTVSLPQLGDRVKVILFTMNHCGACKYAYPIVNAIYDDYPADSVAVFGVLWNENQLMEGVRLFAESNGIRFPFAKDNCHFYSHFFPGGLAPNILVVSRDNKKVLWQRGMDRFKLDKIEKKIREAIDKALL